MTLRASDRDRDETVELLAQAVSDGQLTLEEYSERVDVALAAKLQDELAQVVADLQQAHAGLTVRPDSAPGLAGPGASPTPASAPEKIRTIMSNDQRSGRWNVPAHMQLRTIMGEITLELQEAMLTSHVTRIDAHATMGAINLIVPEGVEVRLAGTAIMGEKKSLLRHLPPPGAPVIEVHARVLMGSIEVRPPRERAALGDATRGVRDALKP